MRLNCCNENLNKLITNKCSAEEKMNTQKLIETLTSDIFRATRSLSDNDYIEVLEGVAENLDDAVTAKKEEQRNQ
jgi:hypothetical protein